MLSYEKKCKYEGEKLIKDELHKELKPLYKELFASDDVSNIKSNLHSFCAQWGNKYEHDLNKPKILFVGKVVNGWVTSSRDVEVLFDGKDPKRILARDDQMQWMSVDKHGEYNTKKSALLRLQRKFTKKIIGDVEDWYSYIAWTNLYKFSPSKGNPDEKLKKLQQSTCINIFNKELEILNPDIVIFLTSGWEKKFIEEIERGSVGHSKEKWKRYVTRSFIKGKVKYIISHHPQGKKESDHIDAILFLLSKTI